jgi:beta-lactamase class D
MNRKFLTLLILIVFVSPAICQRADKEIISEKEIPAFGRILDSLKVDGSILIFDNNNQTYLSNDFSWSESGNLPASTFKIPNSIIALETGVIESDTSMIKWIGEKRRLKVWEQDLTFRQAFQVSCVPCYQEIARRIGFERMKEYLKKFEYNGMVFDSLTLDKFWLEGDSKISQFDQIAFLRKIYSGQIPVSERTDSIMKIIMQTEKTESYTLSGKTGWGFRNGDDNGWYVGYLETDENVYFFATNIVPKRGTNTDDFLSARINATKIALNRLNTKLQIK